MIPYAARKIEAPVGRNFDPARPNMYVYMYMIVYKYTSILLYFYTIIAVILTYFLCVTTKYRTILEHVYCVKHTKNKRETY